jgi:hypothetical protein
LGLPAEGRVRVITGKSVQTKDEQTAHWSVLGERNWTGFAIENTKISLSSPSPLNEATRASNTNIWEIDLKVKPSTSKDKILYEAIISVHGINGVNQVIQRPIQKMSDVSIQTLTDQDLPLPASLSLARIGDETLTLNIAKN